MRALFSFLVLAVAALAPARSQAYTPESGWYWNPAEPGTGIAVEIQDNRVFLVGFLYDSTGRATWLGSDGTLTGNAQYDGEMFSASGGTCLGCSFRPHTEFPSGGHISIVWSATDPTRATLTWGGRTMPITRFIFGLIRSTDSPATVNSTKLLGEWQAVMDFSSVSGSFPFYGDVLEFFRVDITTNPDFIDGCRADNSQDGFCTSNALSFHGASAYFDTQRQRHVIVVDDSANDYLTYVVQIGTNQFNGLVSLYPKGSNPTTWYPVRGFRSASRSFVQTGIGPSAKTQGPTAAHAGTHSGIASVLGPLVGGGQASTDIPNSRLFPLLRQAELRLRAHTGAMSGKARKAIQH